MDGKYHYISVDNEEAPHEILDFMFQNYPAYVKKNQFYSPLEAIEFFKTDSCDLMFTDVEMPEMDGFQMLEKMPNPPLTVILTGYPKAYSEKAHAYYDMGIFDFLSKSFIPKRFKQTLDRFEKLAENKIMLNKYRNFNTENYNFFPVYENGKLKQLSLHDILFFRVEKNYVYLYDLKEKEYSLRSTLQEVMQQLPQNSWLQISRDIIIVVDNVYSYNAFSVNMGNRDDGTKIILPYATRKRREVADFLNARKKNIDSLFFK